MIVEQETIVKLLIFHDFIDFHKDFQFPSNSGFGAKATNTNIKNVDIQT